MEHGSGYDEASTQLRVARVPLSHLSVEVGHLYMSDLRRGGEAIRRQLKRVAPMLHAVTASAEAEFGSNARISTCFLLDDYFDDGGNPAEVIGKLLEITSEFGVGIDYLGRESACHEAPAVRAGEFVPLAEMVAARIVEEPAKGETGSRPPALKSGWLANGKRGSDGIRVGQAMRSRSYQHPEELSRREHSIFLDVEMWRKSRTGVNGTATTTVKWSCPFLASVWQLLRLGILRDQGNPVAQPVTWEDRTVWPDRWADLPAIVQLEPRAKPFAAYRSLSIMPRYYLGIEHAVRVVIDHLQLDSEIVDDIVDRGTAELVDVSRDAGERLDYVFLGGC
ncbi:SCO2522 family protein [Nocardia sp. NPDC057227]|uniref:SCO2522 family protein n=1 Tax=Nocardia sp. NPDC057227 TaxID=3346056 RepID=UPI003633CFF5